MIKKWIKNSDELLTSKGADGAIIENRKLALEIAEAGLESINTEKVIINSIKLENNILSILDQDFDLTKFKRIKVVGFGKASCEAASAFEKILGSKINEGAVIGLNKITCDYIQTFAGTHPRPSEVNIEAGKKIYEIADGSKEDDLLIAIVSGGGSALLCYPESECTQGRELYDVFLKCGQTITEINTIRKHLSFLKGGGLAKMAYPATVIGLIFSDVPGDRFEDVASGPTYKDESTIHQAEMIIHEHNLGKFILFETPKDDKYFTKVHNFVLVSNKTAVEAMAEKAKELGFEANIISTEMYEEVDESLKKLFAAEKNNTVVLAAGEPKLEVKTKGGSGGRSLFMGLRAVKEKMTNTGSVLIPLASDGMDNCDAAGAVIDKSTIEKIEKLGLDLDDYQSRFDAYPIFQKSGDMIMTGATGANVSDLMILLTKK
ncbi:MAG: DUF4147 domain-containing protein [Minisyncoccia bacterium]